MFPPPHDPSHPLNQRPQQISGLPSHPAAQESGRVFMPPPAPPQIDHAEALRQLATLDTFAAAVSQARAQGGPTAALQQLVAQPLRVGPFVLHPVSLFTFLFLQTIDSPFVNGGHGTPEDLARALIAFTDPEAAAAYLTFTEAGAVVDRARLSRDAWTMAAQIKAGGLDTATAWINGQVGGLAAMFPAGEEAGNFPTGATTTESPPESNPPQVLPAGSLSS